MALESDPSIATVLLDLDGTLADTFPDLQGALHRLCDEQHWQIPNDDTLRPLVSHGSRGLIRACLGHCPPRALMNTFQEQFIEYYRQQIIHPQAKLFLGIGNLIQALETNNIPWGIVTNKPEALARQLLNQLPLPGTPDCLIGGDTVSEHKPHPAPLFEAARRCRVAPRQCVYVGDALADMQAANAASMPAWLARWGYLPNSDEWEFWPHNRLLNTPDEAIHALTA